jgi:hypothetical protein
MGPGTHDLALTIFSPEVTFIFRDQTRSHLRRSIRRLLP